MKVSFLLNFIIGLALFWAGAQIAAAQEKILLYYNDRPPYLVSEANGGVSGLTGTPAEKAFGTAKIPFEWVKLPTNRQLLSIMGNKNRECAVGWFKNSEREKSVKYTKAIYRDLPTLALANVAFKPPPNATLEQVLATKTTRVLLKDKFSYGPFIDGLLSGTKVSLIHTTGENESMSKMIRLNIADFMLTSKEEAQFLIKGYGSDGADANPFHLIHFPDMPPGERRYIMCSKQVPDEIIVRLNQAIHFADQ